MSALRKMHDWLEVRLGIDEIARKQLTGYLLPRNINCWYSMGSILLVILGLQAVTGMLLLFSYTPDADKAFASVTHIMNHVPLGRLIRTCHAVGSNMMVAVLFLHMLSVLFMGSYKSPRELNWLSGFTLFNLVLVMTVAGNLLPWSQRSFWTTTAITGSFGAIPYIGGFLVECLRGGNAVGASTLRHFFAMHVAVLPAIFVVILTAHLFFLERIGISTPPFGLADTTNPWPRDRFRHEEYPDGIPFFPDYLLRDAAAVVLYFALFLGIVFFIPNIFLPPLALVPAEPLLPPDRILPPWYLLPCRQALKVFSYPIYGFMIMAAFMSFLALLPFIDSGREKHPLKRPYFLAFSVGAILIWVGLSFWGYYS
jgi:ubiquinol-cytochrome c reductase cytochrome b subunit